MKKIHSCRKKDDYVIVEGILKTINVLLQESTPLSPKFGGMWEAAVKSIKYFVKRMVDVDTPTVNL